MVADKTRKLIICGAGISQNEPSCLPSGRALMKFYISHSCGELVYENLIETTKSISTYLDRDIELPRLETIIGSINSLDVDRSFREPSRQKMINGFSAFENVLPNENHRLLAQLFCENHVIITFNFDVCIEAALKNSFAIETITMKKNGVMLSSDRFGNQLYHLHGSCKEINSLGATISQITKGIPEKFGSEFERIIEHVNEIIFLGYSFSDYFDFIPFLQSEQIILKSKKLTCINHLGYDKTLERKLKHLFPKLSFEVLTEDTLSFLRKLCDCEEDHQELVSKFDWEDAFKKVIGNLYSEEDRYTNITQVGRSIGLMPTIMTKESWPIMFRRMKCIVEANQTNEMFELISSLALGNGDVQSYTAYRDRMTNRNQNLAIEAIDMNQYHPKSSFEKLIKECKKPALLHYRQILDFRKYYLEVFSEVEEVILNSGYFTFNHLADRTQVRVIDMISFCDYLLNCGYRKFSGASQYASIFATRYLLDSIKSGQADQEMPLREIELYSELSAYASIGRAYQHMAMMYAYVFFASHDKIALEAATKAMRTAEFILEKVGYGYYLRQKRTTQFAIFLDNTMRNSETSFSES